MAATSASVSNHVPGDLREVIVDVTCDTSYPTGGYAVAPANLSSIVFADVQIPPATGHIAAWDYSASKLKLFTAQGTEVTNATNVSTVVCRIAFLGRGTS
jgi:hypothetical protein